MTVIKYVCMYVGHTGGAFGMCICIRIDQHFCLQYEDPLDDGSSGPECSSSLQLRVSAHISEDRDE